MTSVAKNSNSREINLPWEEDWGGFTTWNLSIPLPKVHTACQWQKCSKCEGVKTSSSCWSHLEGKGILPIPQSLFRKHIRKHASVIQVHPPPTPTNAECRSQSAPFCWDENDLAILFLTHAAESHYLTAKSSPLWGNKTIGESSSLLRTIPHHT